MKLRPSKDKSREVTFKKRFGKVKQKPKVGPLVFQKEDIMKTNHRLTRLLRGIFYKNRITIPYLSEKYHEYAVNVLHELPSRISTGHGNLIMALGRPQISIKKFEEIVCHILGYDIDMTITLSKSDGDRFEINYNEMMEDLVNNNKDF